MSLIDYLKRQFDDIKFQLFDLGDSSAYEKVIYAQVVGHLDNQRRKVHMLLVTSNNGIINQLTFFSQIMTQVILRSASKNNTSLNQSKCQ